MKTKQVFFYKTSCGETNQKIRRQSEYHRFEISLSNAKHFYNHIYMYVCIVQNAYTIFHFWNNEYPQEKTSKLNVLGACF